MSTKSLSPLERLSRLRRSHSEKATSPVAIDVENVVESFTKPALVGAAGDSRRTADPDETDLEADDEPVANLNVDPLESAVSRIEPAETELTVRENGLAADAIDSPERHNDPATIAEADVAFDFPDLDEEPHPEESSAEEFSTEEHTATEPRVEENYAEESAGESAEESGEDAATDSIPADKSAAGEPKYIRTGRGGVRKVRGDKKLDDLLERVSGLLGESDQPLDEPWTPKTPTTLREAGLVVEDVERIALKFLNARGSASGRQIAAQLRLTFSLMEPLLTEWKTDQLVAFKNSAEMGDYVYQITDKGRERARVYMAESTYFGASPVDLTAYLKAMEAQSIAKQHANEADLKRAFSDLLVSEAMFEKLGPAVNSGRGMFLFGEPGNGKTSIAERITSCFGSTILIPRALLIDGDIMRLFDPGVHEAVDWDDTTPSVGAGLFNTSGVDQRWVRIKRPTIVAGGELTMSELEVTQNPQTKVCEAPLQLKSNCGTLVIDDFGRQTMPVAELLNRWIVPLEKRYDFLNLPSGKKIQVPFDQLIVFSTNLEPRDLVDGAFLRRIPYKIEVADPTPEHFRELFNIMGPILGLIVDDESVDYLIREHFERVDRPFRACQPRDLLLQVRNYCTYKSLPKKTSPAAFDFAVSNYFSVM